jgi:hypothetical protein
LKLASVSRNLLVAQEFQIAVVLQDSYGRNWRFQLPDNCGSSCEYRATVAGLIDKISCLELLKLCGNLRLLLSQQV